MLIKLWVFEFKIELAHYERHDNSDYALSERFPNTDPPTAQERTESCRVPLLASRSQVVLTLRVKPFGDEPCWLLPFIGVRMQKLELDGEHLVLENADVLELAASFFDEVVA